MDNTALFKIGTPLAHVRTPRPSSPPSRHSPPLCLPSAYIYTPKPSGLWSRISPVYLSNLEKDRRHDPADEIVDRIAALLSMSKDEKTEMLDLLAKAKKKPAVASDLPEYINERDIVRVALRTAKDADATDAEWQEFIEKLQKRIIKDNPRDNNGG